MCDDTDFVDAIEAMMAIRLAVTVQEVEKASSDVFRAVAKLTSERYEVITNAVRGELQEMLRERRLRALGCE